ncbi:MULTISPECIES: hypothetical protein [unclassified Rhizobium]|uniref:hypothetical protein n=1 Tax=unclassified Rhizobium TaxID=2613769 RepID=UPI000A616A8B|nr:MULTISPECIES: hypothetical protein [unclassified Rhizobium]
MEELKRVLSREELHALVWSTPILKLAERFGISDRGLGKICAKHLVPTPPRGYWAKIEAGQPAKKTPLRKVANPSLHTIHIGSSTARLSDTVRVALAAAKSENVAKKREEKRSPVNGQTTFQSPGDNPHPSIAAAAKMLRKAKPDSEGLVSAHGVTVHERSRERVVAILHNLALTATAKSAKVEVRNESLHLISEMGSSKFTLTEEKRRQKHIPTAEEQAEYERLLAKRKKNSRIGEWFFDRLEPWPEFDIVYTGKLTLTIALWVNGLRQSWSDGKLQRIETILDAFIDNLDVILAARAENARIHEEAERRREELRRRRELATLRTEREENRLKFLRWVADTRIEIDELRKTIKAATGDEIYLEENKRMITWAQKRLGDLEALTTSASIQAEIRRQNLFPDPDDLFDPEGDPPPKQNYWDD